MKFNTYIYIVISIIFTKTYALETQIGSNGVSGMTFTPNALISRGVFNFQEMDRNIGIARYQGYNFSSTFGISESLEVGGRLSGNTWTTNLYSGDGGNRDLSASGKLQLNSLFGLDSSLLKIAVGAVDYGGAATFYKSNYGVATLNHQNWQLNLGYGKAQTSGTYNTISGTFASMATALTPWASVRFENSNKKTWTGVTFYNESIPKLMNAAPSTKLFLSWDAQISGFDMMGARPVLSIGVKIPLDSSLGQFSKEDILSTKNNGFVESKAGQRTDLTSEALKQGGFNDQIHLEQTKLNEIKSVPPTKKLNLKDDFIKLAMALNEQGFESIDIGLDEEILVIQFSDFVFDHSNLDGVGVALGVLAQNSDNLTKTSLQKYRLVLSKWGTPSVGYSGDIGCLKKWLNDLSCDQQEALKPTVRDLKKWLKSANFEIIDYKPSTYKPRIKINPVQNYYVGTEYGLIDYSIGLEMQTAIPLWKGGLIEFAEVFPVKSSGNYSDYKIFNFTKIRHGVEHTLVHHIERLENGFSARVSGGQLFTGTFKGVQAEIRWENLNGDIESGLTTSYWKSENMMLERRIATPTTTFAKYAPKGQDWSFEMNLGEYWYKDKGVSLISSHWFGDTMLSMYLRRSVPPEPFWPGPLGVTFAGFSVSFPLTPRKAMKPDFFQIKGASQYGFNLGTPVGRADNYIVGANGIPVYIKALVDAPVSSILATDVLDHDRMNLSYLPFHSDRIRYAYLRWLGKK